MPKGNPLKSILADSEDPNEIPQNVEFHQGLRYLLIWKSYGNKVNLDLEILTCDPLICTMNHLKFIVLNQIEDYNSIQRDNILFIFWTLLHNITMIQKQKDIFPIKII